MVGRTGTVIETVIGMMLVYALGGCLVLLVGLAFQSGKKGQK